MWRSLSRQSGQSLEGVWKWWALDEWIEVGASRLWAPDD
jgi:hypothetical protein